MAAKKYSIAKSGFLALCLYITCLVAAWITEWVGGIPGSDLSIWLPAGFLLSACLASPRSTWPIWAASAILAELTGNAIWYHHDLGPAMLLAVGNAVAAVGGAYGIRYFVADRQILVTKKNAAIFLFVAAVAMPLISATTGSTALGWSYDRPWSDAWVRIFLGDATGAAIAAPIALLIFRAAAPTLRLYTRRWLEITALILTFMVTIAVSLGGIVPFAFLLIPPLLWAALSFRIPGAIIGIAIVTTCSALFTLAGMGPFAENVAYASYRNEGLQLFLVIMSTTGLLMGAMAEENRTGIKLLHDANHKLEERVTERSASLALSEARARETANLLSAIGEACPDLIYAKGLDYGMIYANKATLATLGAHDLDELKAKTEQSFLPVPAEFDAIRQNDKRVLDTQETLVEEEIVTTGNGQRRIFRTTKSPLYDAEGGLAGLAGVSVDISDMKMSQARENMLVREVEHRARNLLAVVQGILELTKADTVADMKSKLGKRIRALAQTNGAIAASNWHGASLAGILTAELAPYRNEGSQNIVLTGEDMTLDPATAQSLTLVIHELATNAAKYGCLSTDDGRLSVDWTGQEISERRRLLKLDWVEAGGPPVREPRNEGFGTMVIGVFGQEQPDSDVEFRWKESGLEVQLKVPVMVQV